MNAKGIAVYSGAVDDNPDPSRVIAHYLKDALDAALAGKVHASGPTKAVGTPIKRARSGS